MINSRRPKRTDVEILANARRAGQVENLCSSGELAQAGVRLFFNRLHEVLAAPRKNTQEITRSELVELMTKVRSLSPEESANLDRGCVGLTCYIKLQARSDGPKRLAARSRISVVKTLSSGAVRVIGRISSSSNKAGGKEGVRRYLLLRTPARSR